MSFGGFYKGEKKKPKKKDLEKRAMQGSTYSIPQVEISPKGKNKDR